VYAHLKDWEKARDDARTCVSLRGTWAKGWVRLGHALSGLEEWEEAKEAFSRARDLEPDDQKIEKAWQKVCPARLNTYNSILRLISGRFAQSLNSCHVQTLA
jgi:tetratricopeptide (TPR) repeat protein